MGQSWSAMRHHLEKECLCDSLKGRIRYFVTSYRVSKNNVVTVFFDGKVALHSSLEHWGHERANVLHEIYNTQDAAPSPCDFESIPIERGGFDKDFFFEAYYQYQNQSIEKSLVSKNPIVRMLAVLDRRVGKRQLPVLKEAIQEQPEWLQFFYRLRIDAETQRLPSPTDE